jgi:spore germination protein GerM
MTALRAGFALAAVALLAACGGDGEDSGSGEVVVLFPRLTDTDVEFVDVSREVDNVGAVEAIEELLEGPTSEEQAEGLIDPFPDGTSLLSLQVEGGEATADFSAEILGFGGGSANVQAITGAITETLLAQEGIDSVVILVEGEPDAIQP